MTVTGSSSRGQALAVFFLVLVFAVVALVVVAYVAPSDGAPAVPPNDPLERGRKAPKVTSDDDTPARAEPAPGGDPPAALEEAPAP